VEWSTPAILAMVFIVGLLLSSFISLSFLSPILTDKQKKSNVEEAKNL